MSRKLGAGRFRRYEKMGAGDTAAKTHLRSRIVCVFTVSTVRVEESVQRILSLIGLFEVVAIIAVELF
jgi:hypothetical protein